MDSQSPIFTEFRDAVEGKPEDGYVPVRLLTARADVEGRYYPAANATRGVVWLGGAGGGWDSPGRGLLPLGRGLYPRLCEDLTAAGIASLRIRYRRPGHLEDCVFDALVGLTYLAQRGARAAGTVGWSFGGAVAIQAAAADPIVRTVVTLATQSYGTDVVSRLAPRCSILLIHGTADRTLPPSASEFVYRHAGEPKRIILYEGADHALNQVATEVEAVVRNWLREQLRMAG